MTHHEAIEVLTALKAASRPSPDEIDDAAHDRVALKALRKWDVHIARAALEACELLPPYPESFLWVHDAYREHVSAIRGPRDVLSSLLR